MKLRTSRQALALVALGIAGAAGAGQPPHKRVESMRIDPAACKLNWTVALGELREGRFTPSGKTEVYEISFHEAEMTHQGVTYKFSAEEATRVHQVMLAIHRYAAESVEWFEQQQKPKGMRGPAQRATLEAPSFHP